MYLVIHTVYTAILRSTDKASGELREKKGVVNRVVTPYTTDDTSAPTAHTGHRSTAGSNIGFERTEPQK